MNLSIRQILFFKVLIDNHEANEDQDDGGFEVIKKLGGTSWNFHPRVMMVQCYIRAILHPLTPTITTQCFMHFILEHANKNLENDLTC